MKVPFFDYPQVYLSEKQDIDRILNDVGSRGAFILQDDVENFELELASYLRAEKSIGVGNATDAMELFLLSLNLDRGSEIIISTHTMLATASAIVTAGAVPVPVDIGYDGLMCPDSLSEAINSRTVGVMPTQLNGRTCDMDKICDIATKHNLFICEDAAQSLGSKFNNQNAGTFGLASCISFFPAKVLGSLGDAGAIVTSNEEIYEKSFQLHDHGRDTNGEVKSWGRNSRLDNIQAAFLSFRLKNYQNVINRRREIASMYEEQLAQLSELKLPIGPDEESLHFDVYQNYEIQASRRDELMEYLSEKGIGTIKQWGGFAIHHFKNLGFTQDLPIADKFFEECMLLPMNTYLSNDHIDYVCESIHNFYR